MVALFVIVEPALSGTPAVDAVPVIWMSRPGLC